MRTYGQEPFTAAVVHGGPGAGGEMAPVARELADEWGVLEPIQTAVTLDGQVEELKVVIEERGAPAMIVIGHSWGAWLGWILAARHPMLVGKLILVGSGPFEEVCVARLRKTRLARLGEEEREELDDLEKALSLPGAGDKDAILERFGAIVEKTQLYDPGPAAVRVSDRVGPRGNVFQGVWREAAELRGSGALLNLGRRIACPVAAIHGDYDPHPHEGVEAPVSGVIKNFRFHLLKECGHAPWLERRARGGFFKVLREEIRKS